MKKSEVYIYYQPQEEKTMIKSKKNTILYPDNKNGIYSYEYPTINGIKQYVQVRGTNKNNPLILFLHGGPGGALSGLCHILQKGWEDKYTVANWDQRNACKTYFANKGRAKEIAQTGTMADYIKDIDEVIAYLHTIYDFEKLILMGFSWGTAIGSEYAKQHPENLLCYIGVGQMANYRDDVLFILNKLLDIVPKGCKDEIKIKRMIDTLPQSPVWNKDLFKCMMHYNSLCTKYISKHAKAIKWGDIINSPFINFKEKLSISIPNYSLYTKSEETMISYDFRQNLNYEIPILFIFGSEEPICPNEPINDYLDAINAPVKKLEVIPNAAHMCFFDQPESFNKIVDSFVKSLK